MRITFESTRRWMPSTRRCGARTTCSCQWSIASVTHSCRRSSLLEVYRVDTTRARLVTLLGATDPMQCTNVL